ncbi:MAG: DUF5693 family protein [Synergistaceae bacterium]|nr:DUF5693 family protein [Synergistaceae bacterium]
MAVLLCAGIGLIPRLRAEKENRSVAIVADCRDIATLAQGAGLSTVEALGLLKEKGLGGLMAGEFSGEDILSGLGPVEMRPTTSRSGGSQATLFSVPGGFPHAARLARLLSVRTGTVPFVLSSSGDIGVVYPAPMDALRKSGLIPDLDGLNAGAEAGLPMFYRVAPAQTWQLQRSLAVTKSILSDYPGISLVAPSGEIALGYPDLEPLASLLRERGVPAAMIEFSRQLGASALNRLSFPGLVPLHSVTNEELLARNIDRVALHERLVRAAVERSVRVLLLRPGVSGNVESPLEAFAGEIENLASALKARGLRAEWPGAPFADRPVWDRSVFAALACSMTLLFSLMHFLKRMTAPIERIPLNEPIRRTEAVVFVVLSCLAGVAVWKVGAVARLIGALTAAFVVVEAALLAMDDPARPWRSLATGFLFAIVGGLSVAALFSDPVYMLRLRTFSGVKLTLMLPPVLVALHDMRRRIHPESLSSLLSRPPLFGELALVLFLVALMGVILFRSDNVQFIPGIEAKIRHALERVLVARPRNREVFIGYPSLLLYAFAVRTGLWPRGRELLRLGTTTGFASVVNSFCHYHTPLLFILLREFHGLWTGALLGVVAVFAVRTVVRPAWRRLRFIAE